MNFPAPILNTKDAEPAQELDAEPASDAFGVPAVHLTKLVHRWGSARVAEHMGYNVATINTAIRDQRCRKVMEALAGRILADEDQKPVLTTAHYFLSVPAAKTESFAHLCCAMDLDARLLEI